MLAVASGYCIAAGGAELGSNAPLGAMGVGLDALGRTRARPSRGRSGVEERVDVARFVFGMGEVRLEPMWRPCALVRPPSPRVLRCH